MSFQVVKEPIYTFVVPLPALLTLSTLVTQSHFETSGSSSREQSTPRKGGTNPKMILNAIMDLSKIFHMIQSAATSSLYVCMVNIKLQPIRTL